MSYLFLKIAFERRIAYFLNDDRRACSTFSMSNKENVKNGNVTKMFFLSF